MGKCKIDDMDGGRCPQTDGPCKKGNCASYACTNFERITASPEALANWIASVFSGPLCRWCDMRWDNCYYGECADGVVHWLNQPTKRGKADV